MRRPMLGASSAELLAVVAPPACAACRAPLAARGCGCAPTARRALPWLPRAGCPRCGLPSHAARRCPAARRRSRARGRRWPTTASARDARGGAEVPRRAAGGGLMAAHMAANLPAALRGRHASRRPGAAAARAAPAPRVRPRGRARRRRWRRGSAAGRARACVRRDRARRQVGARRRVRRRRGRLAIELRGAPPPRRRCSRRRPHDGRDARRLRPRAARRRLRRGGRDHLRADAVTPSATSRPSVASRLCRRLAPVRAVSRLWRRLAAAVPAIAILYRQSR